MNPDPNVQSIHVSHSPGIELPELGSIGFTAGGHRLPVPLRYESTQVHFSTYENYDSIPTELLSVLLDLDADDAELESEFWMTASGLLAPNSRTRSRLARKVQSEEEGSDTERIQHHRSDSPDIVDHVNAREETRRAAPFVAEINSRAEAFSRARETYAAYQDCESLDGSPSEVNNSSDEDDEDDDDEGNRPDDSADPPSPRSPLPDFPPTCEQYLERQRHFRRHMQRKDDDLSDPSDDDIDRQWTALDNDQAALSEPTTRPNRHIAFRAKCFTTFKFWHGKWRLNYLAHTPWHLSV